MTNISVPVFQILHLICAGACDVSTAQTAAIFKSQKTEMTLAYSG